MGTKRNTVSGVELKGRGDKTDEDMEEHAEHAEVYGQDLGVLAELDSVLEYGSSQETADAVHAGMDQADDLTMDHFERETDDAEEACDASQEHQDDLQERTDSDNSDLSETSDAASRIDTQETVDALRTVQESLTENINVVGELISKAESARGETEERLRKASNDVQNRGK